MLASKGFSTEDRNSAASGGNNTYTYTHAGVDYKLHKFTSNGTFTINFSVPFDILLVAGGGGGAGTTGRGAGGAGGLRWLTNQHFVNGSYTCSIGGGGANGGSADRAGYSGADSRFLLSGTTDIIADGGGAGAGGSGGLGVGGGRVKFKMPFFLAAYKDHIIKCLLIYS